MPKKKKRLGVVKGGGRTYLPRLEKALYRLIVLLIAVLLVYLGYHWISSWLFSYRLQMETAEPGSLRSYVDVEGLVSRDEEVMHAPRSGVFVKSGPAGERISVGEKAGTLFKEQGDNRETFPDSGFLNGSLPGDKNYAAVISRLENGVRHPYSEGSMAELFPSLDLTTFKPGVLSYRVDGMEAYGPGNYPYNYLPASNTAVEGLEGGGEKPAENGSRIEVTQGDPLFKIVRGWEWYFSAALDGDTGKKVAEKERMDLEFAFGQGKEVEGEIVDISRPEGKDRYYFTFSIDRELEGYTEVRRAVARLYYREHEGVLVPEESLVELEGEKGVYINRGGVVNYKPVEILYSREGVYVVEGPAPYSMVITTPGLVEEGQRLE